MYRSIQVVCFRFCIFLLFIPHPAIILVHPKSDNFMYVRCFEDIIQHVSFSISVHRNIYSELHLSNVQPSVVGKVFIKF